MMISDAFAFQRDYASIKMPVVIVAGEDDRVVDVEQSARLHREIAGSTFTAFRARDTWFIRPRPTN